MVARRLRGGRFTLCGRRLNRNFGRLGQEPGVVRSEYDAAESNRRIDLRLPEWPIGIASVTHAIEQYLGAGLQVVLQFVEAAHGCFTDRKFARIVSASSYKFDQHLGVADVDGVKQRTSRNLLDRSRPKQPTHMARR